MPLNRKIIDRIGQNLRKPSTGFIGFLVRQAFVGNHILERKSVDLLQIEPHHNVLEVGFGPGYGLKCVLTEKFTSGSGKLYGVDFSEAMCDLVSQDLKYSIRNKKVEILCEDVAKMSLRDDIIDKAFHTNSFFFWPDVKAGCSEIYRVMKPSGHLVTVISMDLLNDISKTTGVLKYAKSLDLDKYIDGLKFSGFTDIGVRDIGNLRKRSKYHLTSVTCTKPN